MTARRYRTTVVVALIAGLLSGCGTAITADRVQQTFGAAFTRLYLRQQELMGNPALTPQWVSGESRCQRGDQDQPDRGAGGDWQCHERWRAADGSEREVTYEVQVRANGCLSAGGPIQEVGPPVLNTSGGQSRVNPLYAFDACFDPS